MALSGWLQLVQKPPNSSAATTDRQPTPLLLGANPARSNLLGDIVTHRRLEMPSSLALVRENLTKRELVSVAKRAPTSRVILIQGAPDKEYLQILETTPGLSQSTHQGRVLSLAMSLLSEVGFGDVTLARADGEYAFPEEDVSERIQAASQLLAGEEPFSGAPELFDRLELHIKGSKHSIGAQRVVLKAKPTAN